jgi:hypothetical protein
VASVTCQVLSHKATLLLMCPPNSQPLPSQWPGKSESRQSLRCPTGDGPDFADKRIAADDVPLKLWYCLVFIRARVTMGCQPCQIGSTSTVDHSIEWSAQLNGTTYCGGCSQFTSRCKQLCQTQQSFLASSNAWVKRVEQS